MSLWRRSWNWLRDVCRLSRVEHEMDLELRSHLEAYTQDLICAGMSPEEARRRAHIDFGSFEQAKDDCRNARGINVVETVSQDLRYALRIQRRSWSFAAVTVPTLALGITHRQSTLNRRSLLKIPYSPWRSHISSESKTQPACDYSESRERNLLTYACKRDRSGALQRPKKSSAMDFWLFQASRRS